MSQTEKTTDPGAGSVPARADADAQDGFSNDTTGDRPVATPKLSQHTHQTDMKLRGLGGKHPTPSPSTEKVSGAGPAIAEHSKDAKAPRRGRQPGAYVKE